MSIWNEIEEKLNANPTPIQDESVRYEFHLLGDSEENKQLVLINGKATIEEVGSGEPNCILKMSASDFAKLIHGDLKATSAFMFGKLKVEGSMGYALKLEKILSEYQ
ncbi:SCP2 sterol-binding domain-containing protein [Chryseomicrobium palamuruense]|uniref:SCP2 sterol-binding domain-containing protein n=1 Tax=Chryseomicrobium palamuruense TaxID=682973 RepID=A0ABV8UVZ1_9BACL